MLWLIASIIVFVSVAATISTLLAFVTTQKEAFDWFIYTCYCIIAAVCFYLLFL